MRVLNEQEDRELKDELKELKLIATSHEAEEKFYNRKLVFYRPEGSEPDQIRRIIGFVEHMDPETLYGLLYKSEQGNKAKNVLEKKYSGRSIQINPEDVQQVENDLDEVNLLPADFGWLIKLDQNGDTRFYGDDEFMENVKEFFPDWKRLSELPETDDRT